MSEFYHAPASAQVQDPVICNTGSKYLSRSCLSRDADGVLLPIKLDYLTVISELLNSRTVVEAFKLENLFIKPVRPKFGYTYAYQVHEDALFTSDPIVTVYEGGESQKGTIMFDRSGPLSSVALSLLLRCFGSDAFLMSRADFAVDFEAQDFYLDARSYVVNEVDNWSAGGQRGRKPGVREINDCATGNGSTLYVGSGQKYLFRLYEKGKQLKRKDAWNWVRAEVQYRPDGKPAKRNAFKKLAQGDYFGLWCETPFARFAGYFFGQPADRVRAEQPIRDTALEARAKHFIKQYFGLMQELVGHYAHGDWSELGDIMMMYKKMLQVESPTWQVTEMLERAALEVRCEEELKSEASRGSYNIYYVKYSASIQLNRAANQAASLFSKRKTKRGLIGAKP